MSDEEEEGLSKSYSSDEDEAEKLFMQKFV